MTKLLCPNCGQDVGLTGHEVRIAGDKLQEGGIFATAWNEVCPSCGRVFALHMTVGPVEVFVGQPLEVRR